MKNVLLATTLICGFLIAMFFSEAPRRNEFVCELQLTLIKLSQDVPPLSRVANDQDKVPSPAQTKSASVIAQAASQIVAAPMNARPKAELTCCGWTE